MKSPRAIAALGLLGALVYWKGPAIASGVTQQAYNLIENAGSALTRRSTINCTGTITCSDDSADNRTEINGATGGGGYDTVEDEGVALTMRTTLNFTGAGVTCTDDAVSSRTNCDVPGGGGSGGASRGAFSSRPSCSSSGATYYTTDAPIISECDGMSWADWVFGRAVTLPSSTSFDWQSQGTATLNDVGVSQMSIPTNNGNPNWHGRFISLPVTPFTVDACFVTDSINSNFSGEGIYVSDGTKWQVFLFQNFASSTQMLVANYSNNTTFASTTIGANTYTAISGQWCQRWADDGANVTISTAPDPSGPWTQYGSFARTVYLTPTQIGWAGDLEQTTKASSVTLWNWLVH